MTKIIAFHLPQYHSIPENDEWWGRGFTDWDNLKKATPLFKGHYQPRVPLDGYYNMLDHDTHLRQAELAKEYGVYGFCYYHYWFNGKMLLEKPLEHILLEKDVDLPFCMCWANEPWTRSWDGKSKRIIMPQYYGDKEDWKKHIEYLLPFFKDDRYIKINGKPVFVLYRSNNVDGLDEMITLWNSVLFQNGIEELYLIEERNNFQTKPVSKISKAILDFEPNYTSKLTESFFHKVWKRVRRCFGYNYNFNDYNKKCSQMTKREIAEYYAGKKIFLGMYTGWDNTPRRKNGGTIFQSATPDNFGKWLAKQMARANSINSEFLFLNAWNEWAEGAYLEPDERYGYSMLEAVKRVVAGQDYEEKN